MHTKTTRSKIIVTPRLVRAIILDLDVAKASGPDSIPVIVLRWFEPIISFLQNILPEPRNNVQTILIT